MMWGAPVLLVFNMVLGCFAGLFCRRLKRHVLPYRVQIFSLNFWLSRSYILTRIQCNVTSQKLSKNVVLICENQS